MRLVNLQDVPLQPWRNGGGVTQELLAWPHAADWLLRISVARISSSGPFSAFPGTLRWFTVLSGEGVVLRFGRRRTMLTAGSEPLRFEGAAAPDCDLLDGPTQDLNLILRSSAGRGAMRVAQPGEPWHSDAPLRAVFVQDAATLLVHQQPQPQPPLPLPAGTLAWCDEAASQTWQLAPTSPTDHRKTARAWWLHFKPLPPR